jgi:hypothetical protein
MQLHSSVRGTVTVPIWLLAIFRSVLSNYVYDFHGGFHRRYAARRTGILASHILEILYERVLGL